MGKTCPICGCSSKEQHDHDCPHHPTAPANALAEYQQGLQATSLDEFPDGSLATRPHFLYGLCTT